MKLVRIISQRKYKTAPSFQSVFEWEDIIAKDYPLKIYKESHLLHRILFWIDELRLTDFAHYFIPAAKNKSLRFIMTASTSKTCILNKNVIPVVIDFWLKTNELRSFYEAYKHCPIVLITSAEVVEFLNAHKCPLKIAHWPLSISDKYYFNPAQKLLKEYEFCFIGRPNPFFKRMLKIYEVENLDFIYIESLGTEKNRRYYTNKGQYVGNDTGRDSYINMTRKSKITCYSTPGIDEGKGEMSRFNQVTPRLFEMFAGGCNVIGHYPDNPDTRYYQLEKFIPNVNNYEEFKAVLDRYRRNSNQNIDKYSAFLEKHYTSTRIPMLKAILNEVSNLEQQV